MEVMDGDGAPEPGPEEKGWTKDPLVIPEPGIEPPGECWTKEVSGGTLRFMVWGDGSQGAPYAVQIGHRAVFTPNRFPTWEEIQEAVHTLIEQGVVFALPPFEVHRAKWGAILDALEAGGWSAMPFVQAGVLRHSEVSEKSLIILPGGTDGPARA